MEPEPVRDNEYYTEFEHHEDVPDPRDTGDISRPQGWFWYQNERPGARAFEHIDLTSSNARSDELHGEDADSGADAPYRRPH